MASECIRSCVACLLRCLVGPCPHPPALLVIPADDCRDVSGEGKRPTLTSSSSSHRDRRRQPLHASLHTGAGDSTAAAAAASLLLLQPLIQFPSIFSQRHLRLSTLLSSHTAVAVTVAVTVVNATSCLSRTLIFRLQKENIMSHFFSSARHLLRHIVARCCCTLPHCCVLTVACCQAGCVGACLSEERERDRVPHTDHLIW